MSESILRGCRILVIEDEYLLADELRSELLDAGACVLGPLGKLQAALNFIAAEPAIDAVLLDVNLGGEMAFAAADVLMERGIPVVFTTGYDVGAIPPRFQHLPLCGKPTNITALAHAVELARGALR